MKRRYLGDRDPAFYRAKCYASSLLKIRLKLIWFSARWLTIPMSFPGKGEKTNVLSEA